MSEKDTNHNFEIARKRTITDGNSGLPKNARRFTDELTKEVLKDMWIEQIRFYHNTNYLINDGGKFALKKFQVEESGSKSEVFNCQLRPEVEGYEWYRGFAVEVKGGKVLIFSSWIQPWLEGGAPDPIIYSVGNVSREDVCEVVHLYCHGIILYIATVRGAVLLSQIAYEKAKAGGASEVEALKTKELAYNKALEQWNIKQDSNKVRNSN